MAAASGGEDLKEGKTCQYCSFIQLNDFSTRIAKDSDVGSRLLNMSEVGYGCS